MKHEFHAEYPFTLKDSRTQGFAIQWLAGESNQLPEKWKDIKQIDDPVQKLDILAQAILTRYKHQARTGSRMKTGGYKFWLEKYAPEFIARRKEMMENLGLVNKTPDMAELPPYSCLVRFTFTLRKPYISKDDAGFHILDNPVKKEWVFKIPYVAPSQWKGALRSAMAQELTDWWQSLQEKQHTREYQKTFIRKRLQLVRLFGTEKNVLLDDRNFESYLDGLAEDRLARWFRRALRRYCSSTGFVASCLYFFPTFFDRMGLEVINPHDRETGAGTKRGPILMECAPKSATGEFMLIYAPFSEMGKNGKTPSAHEKRSEITRDMEVVAKGVKAMFTDYGFGAKTSSGYGVAVIDPAVIEVKPDYFKANLKKFFEESGNGNKDQ